MLTRQKVLSVLTFPSLPISPCSKSPSFFSLFPPPWTFSSLHQTPLPPDYWLLSMACSACFIVPLKNTCSGLALHIVGWAIPHQLLIKKISQTCPQAYLIEAFSQMRLPFLDSMSLCQVGRNN